MRYPAILFTLLTLWTSASLPAANIAWISYYLSEDDPAGVASLGFTEAADAGYTRFLTENGHAVTRVPVNSVVDPGALEGFDLVIIGRSTSGAAIWSRQEAWNSLSTPVMIMSSVVLPVPGFGLMGAGPRLFTFDPLNGVEDTIGLVTGFPEHPLFAGIELDSSGLMVNPFAVEVSLGDEPQNGIYVIGGGPFDPNARVLARVGTFDPAGAENGIIIAEWPAGAETTYSGTVAGPRMMFLSGSGRPAVSHPASGIFDLTPDGSRMFLNAVNYMAVPEPGTAILGLVGIAVLAFRKRGS